MQNNKRKSEHKKPDGYLKKYSDPKIFIWINIISVSYTVYCIHISLLFIWILAVMAFSWYLQVKPVKQVLTFCFKVLENIQKKSKDKIVEAKDKNNENNDPIPEAINEENPIEPCLDSKITSIIKSEDCNSNKDPSHLKVEVPKIDNIKSKITCDNPGSVLYKYCLTLYGLSDLKAK